MHVLCVQIHIHTQSYQKGSRHWTFDTVHLQVVYSPLFFPDYKGPSMSNIVHVSVLIVAMLTTVLYPLHASMTLEYAAQVLSIIIIICTCLSASWVHKDTKIGGGGRFQAFEL